MDISTKSVKETTIVYLDGPDGEPMLGDDGKKLSITVYGPGSKPFQKAQAAKNRAILEQVRKRNKKVSDSLQRDIDAEFLATCTESFNGFTYKDLTGSEMFKACYADYSIGYVADQVNKAVGDWANFTKA